MSVKKNNNSIPIESPKNVLKSVKNVIFDLDGTLLDTGRGIIESAKHTIDVMGLRELSDNELRSFVGPPLKKSFMNICGCSEETANEAVHTFRAYYQDGAVLHAEPYQGMTGLCEMLICRGIKLGVATNKPNRFAVALINNFGLSPYFTCIKGADEAATLSKTDLIRLCMQEMGATESDTVLIGDTDNDAAGAEQAGIGFIAVTYGFGYETAEDCSGFPCIGTADTPMQIADVLSGYIDVI